MDMFSTVGRLKAGNLAQVIWVLRVGKELSIDYAVVSHMELLKAAGSKVYY